MIDNTNRKRNAAFQTVYLHNFDGFSCERLGSRMSDLYLTKLKEVTVMKCISIDRFLLNSLMHEKKIGLNLFEILHLRWLGTRDASHGLPRENGEGKLTSPTIAREFNSLNESHNKIYGMLQLHLSDKYKRAVALAEILKRHKFRMKELSCTFPAPITEEECNARRNGEEGLTDSQVRRRRLREHENSIKKVQEQIDTIREKAEKDLLELLEINSFLNQMNHETEIVCKKIRCHVQQRIDCYWAAALYKSFGSRKDISSTYSSVPVPEVVANYKVIHQRDNSMIAQAIHLFVSETDEEKEVA